MLPSSSEIAFSLLKYLGNGEIHTLISSTLYLQKYFNLTEKEKNDFYPKRKSSKKEHVNISSTKFYKKVVDVVHILRKDEYLKDFPGTKDKGIFFITDDGIYLLSKNKKDIQSSINSRFTNYHKIKKSSKK